MSSDSTPREQDVVLRDGRPALRGAWSSDSTPRTAASAKPYPRWWPHGAADALRAYRTRNTVNGKTFDEILDAALDNAYEAGRAEAASPAASGDAQVLRNRLLSQLPSDYRPMLDELLALAASPPLPEGLDVERLARALDRLGIEGDRMGIPARRADGYRQLADEIAAEYARLASREEQG